MMPLTFKKKRLGNTGVGREFKNTNWKFWFLLKDSPDLDVSDERENDKDSQSAKDPEAPSERSKIIFLKMDYFNLTYIDGSWSIAVLI